MKCKTIVFSVVLVLFVFCFAQSVFASGTAVIARPFSKNADKNQPNSVVLGEYMVVFSPVNKVLEYHGVERRVAVSVMLTMQADYLHKKYGVRVMTTYDAISESNGRGMFHIKAYPQDGKTVDEKMLIKTMREDVLIDSVEPNTIQKMI